MIVGQIKFLKQIFTQPIGAKQDEVKLMEDFKKKKILI